ncbi:hypothetical protein CES85_2977 (plasmid) [Ochrobactrum quorumnocens]|uniref:Uncharacterized protein n=1 Tax=Ochrobactrum quorumnocens TaxID=271865 RepID=A0A248UMB3_9HYPH|nr:hypothetical protein CES85_2977 [[Ochrobactrum] quorumnocens]
MQNVIAELDYRSVNAFITMFKKASRSTSAFYSAQRIAHTPSAILIMERV